MSLLPPGVKLHEARRSLHASNKAYPKHLIPVPPEEWPRLSIQNQPQQVFRSRMLVAQIFPESNGAIRVSVNRSELESEEHWKDGITWDELQEVKSQIGFSHAWGVEIFPPTGEVVNVANIRHLWIIPEPPAFAWKK